MPVNSIVYMPVDATTLFCRWIYFHNMIWQNYILTELLQLFIENIQFFKLHSLILHRIQKSDLTQTLLF